MRVLISTDLYPGSWFKWKDQLVDVVASDIDDSLTRAQVEARATAATDAAYAPLWTELQLNYIDERMTGRAAFIGTALAAFDALTAAKSEQPDPTDFALPNVNLATTANIALTGAVTVDGVAAGNAARVLVKNQTDSSQNGIYLSNTGGAWTRAADVLVHGSYANVLLGTANGGKYFSVTTADPFLVGEDDIAWAEYTPPADVVSASSISAVKELGRLGQLVSPL